jgi:hypothetical protein
MPSQNALPHGVLPCETISHVGMACHAPTIIATQIYNQHHWLFILFYTCEVGGQRLGQRCHCALRESAAQVDQ